MSLIEIEAELEKLTAGELRELALKSWSVFMAKGGSLENLTECSEEDQRVLAALDEAIAQADALPQQVPGGS